MTENTIDFMYTVQEDKQVFELAKQAAYDYIDSLKTRTVYPDSEALANLKHFKEPLPEGMTDPKAILEQLNRYGSPATVSQSGPRYFAFMNGGVLPPVVALKWLTDTWDQNTALFNTSPISNYLEDISQQWLIDLLQLPKETTAGFVSGTTLATFTGMAAARQHLLAKQGWDVNRQGLYGAPKLRLICGEEAHGTVVKSVNMLGLGQDQIEWIPADKKGRLDATQLPPLDENCIIVLQAGNINSGAFDDFTEICTRANAAGAWVHVDAAFGLWARASAYAHLTTGIELANSWSVDGHKTLNTPYCSGIILCRHKEAMVKAMENKGSYLQHSEDRDGLLFTPSMSRRSRGTELWVALKFLGRQGVHDLVNHLVARTQQFEQELEQAGIQMVEKVEFNVLMFRGDTPEETAELLAGLQNTPVTWMGAATWKGERIIRISVCSWMTSATDVTQTVQEIIRIRNQIKEQHAATMA